MIKVINIRIKDGQEFSAPTQEMSVEKALNSLVQHEIGFGGTITECVPQMLEVVTVVFGCRDTTRFEGNLKDMELLYAVGSIWATMVRRNMAENNGSFFSKGEIAHAAQRSGGNPAVLSIGAGILASEGRAKMIYICLLAEDESDVPKLAKKTQQELFDLVVMKRIHGEDVRCLID